MTSIAGSLQTDIGRHIPISSTNSGYMHTASREASKLSNGAGSKSNHGQQKLFCDGKNVSNTNIKTLNSRSRTMISSPPTSCAETSDVFLVTSSHSTGYLPQYEAVSRNAQVSFISYYNGNSIGVYILYSKLLRIIYIYIYRERMRKKN